MTLPTFTGAFSRVFTVAALTALSATAQAQPSTMPHAMQKPDGMSAQHAMPAPGMDMKSMMAGMNDKMAMMKPSGNTDVDFAMMMRMHHQAAVTMAEAELQSGKDPQMRVMARDIIYAQKKEIAVFDKFLAKRGEPGMKMGDAAAPMGQ